MSGVFFFLLISEAITLQPVVAALILLALKLLQGGFFFKRHLKCTTLSVHVKGSDKIVPQRTVYIFNYAQYHLTSRQFFFFSAGRNYRKQFGFHIILNKKSYLNYNTYYTL